MRRGSEWLSQGAEVAAAAHEKGSPLVFDYVIVGSGYGGAVAAARLAEHETREGHAPSICILERGLEYLPGDFPDSFEELPAHVRINRTDETAKGFTDGLFDFKLAGDVSALVANGLGGGSLINAGVAEEADTRALAHHGWPDAWRSADWPSLYARARSMLQASRWPSTAAGKEPSMSAIATRLHTTARGVDVTIALPGTSVPGSSDALPLQGCAECGDCFSGCNVGAKLTLSHSYLKLAWQRGVAMFTGANVRRVVPSELDAAPHRWVVEFQLTDRKRLQGRNAPFEIHARNVVLSAGTFGTTEILFRSRGGLSLSPRLGERFSANGDTIGAQYGLSENVAGYADETIDRALRRVGPAITHLVDKRDREGERSAGAVIENMTVPAAMGWVFGEVLTALMIPQRWTVGDYGTRSTDSPDPYVVDDGPGGAVRRTLLVATQGDDGANGVLEPSFTAPGGADIAGVKVRWPGVGDLPCFHAADEMMASATPDGAHWIRNPMWQGVPPSPLLDQPKTRGVLTVHPLGGCAMSDSWREGVVDPFGRVFNAPSSDGGDAGVAAVHPGLFVLDGSIIPISLGINPLLTISAVAEGCIDQWAKEGGWRHRSDLRTSMAPLPAWQVALPAPVRARNRTPTAIRFHERMTGPVKGPAAWRSVTGKVPLELSMRCDFASVSDLSAFLRSPRKQLGLVASFSAAPSRWHANELRFVAGPSTGDEIVLRDGQVFWFEQQAIGWVRRLARSGWAWLRGRSIADLSGRLFSGLNRWSPGLFPGTQLALGKTNVVVALWNALTHFGAPRLLRYDFGALQSEWVIARDEKSTAVLSLPTGTRLHGAKSLVYRRGGNPWEQLTKLRLMAQLPTGPEFELATMTFDELYMLDRDRLPLTVLSQANGVRGMRDVASLALFFGRTLAGTHFPTFRAPEYEAEVAPHRLPTTYRYPGTSFGELLFEQHRFSSPTRARDSIGHVDLVLTRYRSAAGRPDATPVLMLHGFGASGAQFTHPKVRVPMAAYLAATGQRDVWVGELRTSIGLESSRAQWTMDDVAQEDVPALVREVLRLTSQDRLDVVAHCIGSAMFCMAALSGKVAGMVRRATLMQVGPVVHLPRTNRMRGYLGHRAQQLLGKDFVDSTMDDRASDADRVLDRVLGSYPFLGGRLPGNFQERRLEPMPLGATLWRNQRRLNALRSAGVFGQLFQWRNMDDPALLDALPDLLGHCNLTTYQQTVYYAFERRLTNQAGQDVYVTDDNIRRHFAFPVLFVQGDLNDTFDRRGTLDSARLVKRVHGDSHPVFRTTIKGYGHLDCVVGKEAPTLVYPRIEEFLRLGTLNARDSDALALPRRRAEQPLLCRQPAIGPWIGHAAIDGTGTLTLRLGLKVDDQRTPPPWIVSMLIVDGKPIKESLAFHATLASSTYPPWAGKMCKALHVWNEGEAVIGLDLPPEVIGQVKSRIQVRVCTPFFEGPAVWPDLHAFLALWSHQRRAQARRSGAEGIAPRDRERVDQLSILRPWLDAAASTDRTLFALGSCRQTPILFDRDLADSAFASMLETGPGRRPLNHVLMVGDQIYADAMASVESVRGTRARFADAHREAWTAPSQRELMRRLPVYMAVDDHEFADNYDDTTRKDFPVEFGQARDAWWRYQLAAGPAGEGQPAGSAGGPAWYEFTATGFEYFVCDTRSEREDGGRLDRDGARIMSLVQKEALEEWTVRTRIAARQGERRPRFVVLPSPLFPFFAAASGPNEYAVRSDAWQRFPDCMQWLLQLILDDRTGDIVLLCGDYHLFADCEIKLSSTSNPATVVRSRCITTSGVYCPYDFANTSADDLLDRAEGVRGDLQWSYRLNRADHGSGYVLVEASAEGLEAVTFVSKGAKPSRSVQHKAVIGNSQ